jgi:hypothetical protein
MTRTIANFRPCFLIRVHMLNRTQAVILSPGGSQLHHQLQVHTEGRRIMARVLSLSTLTITLATQ